MLLSSIQIYIVVTSMTSFNPSRPNISMHILHTILHIILRCRQGEFVYQSRTPLVKVIISLILMTLMCDSGVIL